MLNVTPRKQYDDEFVQRNVEFGQELSKLRHYRDDLRSRYSVASMEKVRLGMQGKDIAPVQQQLDELQQQRSIITGHIDRLMNVQSSYLKTCIHNS